MSSKIEQAFEKRTKNVFVFIFPIIPTLTSFFLHFLFNFKKNYFISCMFTKFMWWILFLKMSMTFIKVVRNQIFKKVYFPLKPTWHSCFFIFHSYDPKQKQNHQISIIRAKIRSTQSQTCVKYRGFIICIKRNTDVNTGDLKILHKKMSKKGWFSRHYLQFLQNFVWFAFNFMLDWRAMTVTIHLALIVSPVLWLLSSCNTLSVTHSDTASYLEM